MSKYHAKPTVYAGVRYDSKREAQYAAFLDVAMRIKGKDRVEDWRRQVPFRMEINGVLVCRLILDFEVEYADGRIELHEVKGVETREFKLKMRLFRALYPEHIVRIIR